MKYCTHCGTPLEDSAKFCNTCGTPVSEQVTSNGPAPAAATNEIVSPPPVSKKKRWGIAAQFDDISAGKRPKTSYFTYLYGFFQLLFHKSYQLFCRTYLPCCLVMIIDFGLLAYALTAVPSSGLLSGIALLLLLIVAIWFVVVSIWMSRYYPQELYKQVQGDVDKIPKNIFAPILGGIVLVFLTLAAVFIGYLLSLAGPNDAAINNPDSTVMDLPAEEPLPSAMPDPTTSPTLAPDMASDPAPETSPEEMYCLVPASEPWKGAWCNEDGTEFFIFEGTVNTVDTYLTNEDGSITIYRADERDGSTYEIYNFSSDETELTLMDPDGNVLGTYYRPTYDMAPNPLPASYWGGYMLVEDNTITEYNPFGDLNQLGSSDNFIIDAFRFGIFPYEQLTDHGNETWSAYFPIPPEGGFYTFGFVTEGEDMYMEIYDDAGNVRGRYQRMAQ